MRLKKGLAGIVLLSLIGFAAAGCAGNKGNEGEASSSSSQSPTQSQESGSASSEAPTEKTIYTMGVEESKLIWGGSITKKLTEKTGVELKYDAVLGDLFQKWDIWLAASDYPDIIRLDNEHLQKYIDAGAVIPLDELIDQYGPNIKAKWGDSLNLLKHDDGHIYSLYSVNATKEAPANAKAGFVVQYDVLKEAGFPTIKTLDQLYDVVKAYAAKHPKIDGKDTIAFGAAMNSWTINVFFNNAGISAAGRPDHGNFVVEDSGDVHWNPVSNYTKDYYKFMNKLFNENLLDKEAFSMGEQELKAKMAQGRVLAAYAPSWFSNPPEASLRAAELLDRQYAHIPVYFNESVSDHSNAMTIANGGTHEWAITANAKNPEKIIKFFDYLFSDEGQILTQWGIEGVHYELKDGKRTQTAEWVKQKLADPDAIFKEGFRSEYTGQVTNWFSIGDGAKLADGDFATPITQESVRSEYDEKTLEVLDKYGISTWADLLPPVEKVPAYLWQLPPPSDSKFKVVDQKLDDLRRKTTSQIIMAKDDAEFEKLFAAFVASAKDIGLDMYEESFTKIWKDYLAEYNATLSK
ncbi:extracellular solute-binding protein [Cohnella silvisoli]|uniref:Extracellular solute-binding protein n=1 Tax=Cohnella silvisoli TaxID=2873699 RepID=A0ABV1KU96_9BACL|nr:extracellular solute-binding protein [Cohnella silvisoli]MCD9023142.1 extracellular solute-binding protein [Cohnella silvisoli]